MRIIQILKILIFGAQTNGYQNHQNLSMGTIQILKIPIFGAHYARCMKRLCMKRVDALDERELDLDFVSQTEVIALVLESRSA